MFRYHGKATSSPNPQEAFVGIAEPGMYITKNSVYIVNRKKDNTMTVRMEERFLRMILFILGVKEMLLN